ncbi:MAG: NAD(+)/NADH kinase [Candidatus Thorarchaeota archaeon]
MKFGIVSRTDKPAAVNFLRELISYLKSKNLDIILETDTSLALELPLPSMDIGEMEVDYLLTVGGDGTIIRASMQLRNPGTPILGINMGSRGFLTEVEPNDAKTAIDMVLENEYNVEECLKLGSMSPSIKGRFPDALNEVLIASALPSKTLDMRLSVDGEFLFDVQADGFIIAPPTGSTAYNLSAGGSIIAPNVDSMILTAICPYSYFRSIVIPSASTVKIELLKPRVNALVIIDGREYAALKPKSIVEIFRSQHKTRFVRFKSFYHRLERRLFFRKML